MRSNHSDEALNTLPEGTDVPGDLHESIQDTAGKLIGLSEKLRLKLHLAGLEAKDLQSELFEAWDGLSRKLSDYAATLEKTKESTEVQLHLGLMDARQRWEDTLDQAGRTLNLLKEDREKALAFLQNMRLQAHLAKEEASETIQNTKEGLTDNVRDITRQGASALKRMNRSISEFLQNLS